MYIYIYIYIYIYAFIFLNVYLFWLLWGLVVARGIFAVAWGLSVEASMQDLVP